MIPGMKPNYGPSVHPSQIEHASRRSEIITYDRQQDVDQEVGTATSLEKDSEGREEDGEDDLANVSTHHVSVLQSHIGRFASSAVPVLHRRPEPRRLTML